MSEEIRQVAARYLERPAWWGWQIPVYLFLGGIAAGLMVLISLRLAGWPQRKRSDASRFLAWLAPACLSLGMLALWLDLERRWHVPRFYLAFRPKAPMSWGAWILLAVYPLALLQALGELPARWKERIHPADAAASAHGWRAALRRLADWAGRPASQRNLAWGNILCGAALGIYTGVLLSAMAARPLWNNAVLGPLFLVSGLSTGAAVLLLFRVDTEERHALSRIDAGLIVIELALLGLFLLGLAAGGRVQQAAGRLLLGGAYTPAFWGLVVLAGLAVPLLAEFWEIRGHAGSRWFAAALLLLGGLALRWILVSAGQVSSWAMM